jgi:hypothetical protein
MMKIIKFKVISILVWYTPLGSLLPSVPSWSLALKRVVEVMVP